MEAFQRSGNPLALFLLITGSVTWNAFKKEGWKGALIAGTIWSILTAVSIYQFRRQKRQMEKDWTFLVHLKARYGQDVYSGIKKRPHSLYYKIFQKRFPPFNRPSLELP